jgi:hypothetical protein
MQRGGWGSDQGATRAQRLTVPEAADRLGLSLDAVRSRIKRGTLPTEREDGRVYVRVGDVRGDQGATDQATDQPPNQGELVAELREQVSYLRDQLRREQDAHAEARRLLAGALERIPAIEAPETPESADAGDTPTDDREGPQTDAERLQRADERPSWWRRVFGA